MRPYIRLLALIAFNRVYDSRTLSLAFNGGIGAPRLRTRALQNNHIRKVVISKRERTVHSAVLYELTQDGLNYLIESVPYIKKKYIPSDAGIDLCTLRPDDRRKEKKETIARANKALTLAEKTGAYISHENYTTTLTESRCDEEDGEEPHLIIDTRLPLADYIKETLTEKDLSKIGLYADTEKNKGKLEFHFASYVKSVSGDANSVSSSADFLKGRYGGVIDSEKRSVFLFGAPLFGMTWAKWVTMKEWATYQLWMKTHALASVDQFEKTGSCAALIVDNPRQFANLYHDRDEAQRSEGEEFGGGFDHFYILPQDEYGVKHLAWLMEHDDEDLTRAIMDSATESGAYFKNVSPLAKYFPLMDEDGTNTALGFLFDAKTLLRIDRAAQRNATESFNLLCYPWQEKYYQMALANTKNINIYPIAQAE